MEILGRLGIDMWGVLLYLVNFGILLFLMERYLLRPMFAMMDKRRDQIKSNVEEAEGLRKTFQEETAKMKQESEEQLKELKGTYASLTDSARKEAQVLLSDAEEKRSRMIEETREHIETMKASLIADAEKEILVRMEQVVKSVLGKSVPPAVVAKSVDESWKELAK